MICGWQIFMRLKTQPVLAPYRGGVKPPVQLVVVIRFCFLGMLGKFVRPLTKRTVFHKKTIDIYSKRSKNERF